MPHFVDVWPALHPHEKGYTFDQSTNPMLGQGGSWVERMRYDRFLVKSNSSHPGFGWKPVSIDLIGTTSTQIEREGIGNQSTTFDLCPSDHYGLIMDLEKIDDEIDRE